MGNKTLLNILIMMDHMKPQNMIKIGSPGMAVYVRKSTRARRLSIRIPGATGKVFLIVPEQVSLQRATQFALEKEQWIRKQLKSKIEISKVVLGSSLPIEGFNYLIEGSKNRRIKFEKNKILIPVNYTDFAKHLKVCLLELSRQRFFSKTNFYCDLIGRKFVKINIKDPKTRWGSCTSTGNLMYSWRLILAPKSVLEYLVVHEVSHLVEMNHSIKFWQHVEKLMPNFRESQLWLKKNGQKLHSYHF